MIIDIQKLHPDAVIPFFGSKGAAAFDICSIETLTGFARLIIGTGFALEIPEGYELHIRPRSGLAFKHATHAFGGTIDSDYRGEIKVLLMGEEPGQFISVKAGEPIAQGVIKPIVQVTFNVVHELSKTERGTKGFGHTSEKK